MKKILSLLLVFVMLLGLTACGGGNETTPTDESTEATDSTIGSTNDATDGTEESTEGTEGTTEATTPENTAPPATEPTETKPAETTPPETKPAETTPPETQPIHTHSYSSKVTKKATCTETGTKTYTCSCGDSYTEDIKTTGHDWGDWKVGTSALVGRDGTEKRTCSICSATETRDSTRNAAFNSFHDWGLVVIVMNDYGSINASTLLEYACCVFDEYHDKPVPSATIFDALSARFDIDFSDTLKNEMKAIGEWRYGYNKTDDTFTLFVNGIDPGEFKLLGYVHNGGNKYTIYYSFTPHGIDVTLNFAVELEYNKLNGEPNRYLSIGRVDELPGDMIE